MAVPFIAAIILVGVAWLQAAYSGVAEFGGDLVGHAGAARWLDVQSWWVWRGWSDWFYGGQVFGVNYPPLGLFWLRLSDPLHGQFVMVAVGLLVLFPWAVWSVGRALGVRVSASSWAVLFTLVVFAGNAHWLLPGFHSVSTGFGSWPAMIATLLGLVVVARAVELSRPMGAGVLAGVAVLFNATVIPGVAVMVAVVLVAGMMSERRRVWEVVWWAAVVGLTALAVCGWWLVPFLHGWDRLVPYRLSLRSAVYAASGQVLLVVLLVVVLVVSGVVLGGRGRWVCVSCGVVLLAAALADAVGYLRAERWVTPAVAMAIVLCALAAPHVRLTLRSAGRPPDGAVDGDGPSIGGAGDGSGDLSETDQSGGADGADGGGGVEQGDVGLRGVGGVDSAVVAGFGADDSVGGRWRWALRYLTAAGAVVASVLSGLYALVPVVIWVLWRRRWAWVRYGAPAWCALLVVIPATQLFSVPERSDVAASAAMTLTDRADVERSGGFVYLQQSFEHVRGGQGGCGWGDPWEILAETDTTLRPLAGLYRETSPTAEFIDSDFTLNQDLGLVYESPMDAWADAWAQTPPGAPIDHQTAAVALGADWYVFCDSTDTITSRPLQRRRIGGTQPVAYDGDTEWRRAATVWWANLLTNQLTLDAAAAEVPAMTGRDKVDWDTYPTSQAARGLTLTEVGDSFSVEAETSGWVWVRIPWDPYWHSHTDNPVLKGGPGHLIVWVDEGPNNYGWWVPRQVDITAIITTTTAATLTIILLITGRRRRGGLAKPDRSSG